MTEDEAMAAGPALADAISLGVLTSFVPRDAVDQAVAVCGKQARRSGGKLPPHVMVYFVMALALFAGDDYEEVITRLAGTLQSWGCWRDAWEVPTSGGITQARQRLGHEPLAELFTQVAGPVADLDTAGAFLQQRWRLMSVDGLEWDAPATAENIAAFGASSGAAFPKVRVVTLSECGSHAVTAAVMGPSKGKGSGEQTLARRLYPRLEPGWLLLADRKFYGWHDWCAAADTGADLLWRVRSPWHLLPVMQALPDGSYLSVLISQDLRWAAARRPFLEAAARGEDLDPAQARYVRVIEYEVPGRDGNGNHERFVLITTITRWQDAPAAVLAQAYPQRWEHEGGNAEIKTGLRGPGKILRSKSPDMIRQEIWGYLLTHYAISALICQAATAAGTDPDQVSFTRTVRIIRRQVTSPGLPAQRGQALARITADITRSKNLIKRRHRSYPRVVRRAKHSTYRVKKPADKGTRHTGPPAIKLLPPAAA